MFKGGTDRADADKGCFEGTAQDKRTNVPGIA